ncbi:hypothetical protein [Saccharibacillus kuerlensis]|uniref:Uncharacterized protein n=1 Tax=Saccharibacillus kuerlensis TaxID=459527 RepID=A0ABQ2KVR0_9BACL|nr:hypothetical protein [Saccharibacillus kuerlensis]GGN94734.1 hypothetical protein GCM10010969_09690 [Saccharibacillus kuerlensis]
MFKYQLNRGVVKLLAKLASSIKLVLNKTNSILNKNFIVWIPFLLCTSVFLFSSGKTEKTIALAFLGVILLFNILNNKWLKKDKFIVGIVALLTLVSCFYIEFSYFVISLILISILSFKVFNKLGISFENFFVEKGMPELMAILFKFFIWSIGFFIYLFLYGIFLIKYLEIYPENNLSKALLAQPMESVINFWGMTVFSLIVAGFIIDFLIRFVMKNVSILNIRSMTKNRLYEFVLKLAVIIVFVDISYSLLYFSFSNIATLESRNQNNLITNYFVNLRYIVETFYYAFCLHFAVPMPETTLIEKLDTLVKNTPHLLVIQFFHFCMNKIVDITILAYSATTIFKIFNSKEEIHTSDPKI